MNAMLDCCESVVIIPTLNAASEWPRLSHAILAQRLAPERVLIVDSASTDGTAELARRAGFRVAEIASSEFDHGGTRQWGAQFFPQAKIIVYLTQDAILANPDALQRLLFAFNDPQIGAAFGRQLPRPEAGPIEAHARLFNYPAQSSIRSLSSREDLGLKAAFLSNSFAAYRRTALEAVGRFPENVIFGEDTIMAARLLLSGWHIAYVADAQVYHSHDYSLRQEFARNFDIGVLHAREPWLLKEFGGAGREGRRFVQSELSYLWAMNAALIPSALVRTALKLSAYRLGRMETNLSKGLKRRLSMNQYFWAE